MGSRLGLAAVRPPERDWAGLIARIANGDTAALAAFYDGTVGLVHGLAVRILDDPGLAEEVTADTYLQIWRQAARYDPARGGPLAWLLTVARSRAIDRLRARATERAATESFGAAVPLATTAPDPVDDVCAAERRGLVERALARLGPAERRVIELAFFRGLSHSEIASTLGQPLGTVKTRIRSGMIRMRAALADAGRESL